MNGYVWAGMAAVAFTASAWYLLFMMVLQVFKILDDWQNNK